VAGLRVGNTFHGFGLTWFSMVMFFFSQWDVYFSGQLFLGPFNVTETQFLIMVIHACAYVFGADFWLRTLSVPVIGVTLSYGYVVVIFAYGLGSVSIRDFMRNVWTSLHKPIEKKRLARLA